jgi:uncharacterized protein (DUF885 family)
MTDRFRRVASILLPASIAMASCVAAQPPKLPPSDERVKALADTYLESWLERHPDQVTYFGVPDSRHDRLPDNSAAALRAWHQKEDVWMADARAIDPATIENRSLRATYAIVREALEGAIGSRVCRNELWNVSQMTGWQVGYGYLVTIQPVGTDEARKDALARWGSLPDYLDAEIANLREGLRLKFSAPAGSVRIVIDQIDALIAGTGADQPFLSPSQRDETAAFRKVFDTMFEQDILPAFRRYRDFLRKEYLPAARTDIAVAANPDGAACYQAAIRQFSTLSIAPRDVHGIGLTQMDGLKAEMQAIAERSFQTSDVQKLLNDLKTDRKYLFKDRDELIDYSKAALTRARAAAPAWFGLLPRADVVIEPYPKYREKNAPNEYNTPAEDGSRPGLFYISAYEAEKKSKSGPESTAFHETIPGHHLQAAVALERKENHPIGRYLFNSGYAEGWGLYSERLADEMKLYTSDLDRLGMLSSQAFRAARLVVDTGMHAMGWSRQQAIDYMLAHTTEGPDDVASEIDRYIVWPGQATSYMLGMLEIRKARTEAQQAMGARFDIKAFHDRVLEDGAVPVSFLAEKIRAWSIMGLAKHTPAQEHLLRARRGDGAEHRLSARIGSARRLNQAD